MKYYTCRQYNQEGKYCSHRYVAVPDNKRIKPYLRDYEECNRITKEEYDKQMPFYQVEVKSSPLGQRKGE